MPGRRPQATTGAVQGARRGAPLDHDALGQCRVGERDFDLHQRHPHRLAIDAGVAAVPPWRQLYHVGRNLDAAVEHAQRR
ncbi:MAG: hypothetical protein IPH76_04970 [Xanthomonadales bacterium]|nr:hypothetical protein [Xanthomonadales bacterium]